MAPTEVEVDFTDEDLDPEGLLVVLDVEITLEVKFDGVTLVLGFVVLKRI